MVSARPRFCSHGSLEPRLRVGTSSRAGVSPRAFAASRDGAARALLVLSNLLALPVWAGTPPSSTTGQRGGVGAISVVDDVSVVVCAAALAFGLLARPGLGVGRDSSARALVPGLLACVAVVVAGQSAGIPGALVAVAGAIVLLFLARGSRGLHQVLREHGQLVVLPVVVALLAAADRVDASLTTLFADASAWLLRLGGAEATVDGSTLYGLGAPLFVTVACAGTLVTFVPLAVAATVTSLLRVTAATRWRLTFGFAVVAAVVNLARIVFVGAALRLAGVDAAQQAHDVVGWVFAVALYAGLAGAAVLLQRRARGCHASAT
jgi:exosortase/archaeosortase family protein